MERVAQLALFKGFSLLHCLLPEKFHLVEHDVLKTLQKRGFIHMKVLEENMLIQLKEEAAKRRRAGM